MNIVHKSRIDIVVCDLNFEKRTISKISSKKFKTIRKSQNEGPLEIEMHSMDSESGQVFLSLLLKKGCSELYNFKVLDGEF